MGAAEGQGLAQATPAPAPPGQERAGPRCPARLQTGGQLGREWAREIQVAGDCPSITAHLGLKQVCPLVP